MGAELDSTVVQDPVFTFNELFQINMEIVTNKAAIIRYFISDFEVVSFI